MPTGYTADVQNGKITTLREYALRCARGMGACIMMRDERWDAPIPERFEPSQWNAKNLVAATARLVELEAMTADEADAQANEGHAEALAEHSRRKVERAEERRRYEDMRAQVQVWTTEAEGIRAFMLDQLNESIRFDCSGEDYPEPERLDGAEWREAQIAKARRDIAYHTRAHSEEVARTEGRNEWLAKLRASLPADGVATTADDTREARRERSERGRPNQNTASEPPQKDNGQ